MKEILLVDQDGVLADYEESFLRIWRARHPDKVWIPIEERVMHNVDEQYPIELKPLIRKIIDGKGFYRNLKPIDGAVEALKELKGHYDVFICTSPAKKYPNCVTEKYEWVDEHLGNEWTQRVILTRDKTLITGKYLIDDKPEIKGMAVPSWEQIFYDWPYNRKLDKKRIRWNDESWRDVLLS